MPDLIYLDHAASSPLRPETVEAVSDALGRYANPSAIHGLGQDVRKRIESARASVAALLEADPSEICFTSGATEANNLALRGVLEPLLDAGKRPHAVTTALEHASVLKTLEHLETRGLELTVIAPGADGAVRVEDVEAALRPNTALVSVIAVSNELGSLQPVRDIGKCLEVHSRNTGAPKPIFHTDAVQAVVSTDLTMRAASADLMTVSAHKIGGPKGAGALVIRSDIRLQPILTGGGQERGVRSGTENTPAILGFGAAAQALLASHAGEIKRYQDFRAKLFELLPPAARPLLSSSAPAAPHIFAFECLGKENDWIALLLNRAGVMVSAGSSCKSGSREASSVVKALGLDDVRARSVLRASCGWTTTEKDVEAFIDALRSVLAR